MRGARHSRHSPLHKGEKRTPRSRESECEQHMHLLWVSYSKNQINMVFETTPFSR